MHPELIEFMAKSVSHSVSLHLHPLAPLLTSFIDRENCEKS